MKTEKNSLLYISIIVSLLHAGLLLFARQRIQKVIIEMPANIFKVKFIKREDAKTVVSTEITNITTEVVDSQFLGKVNQKVEKQTVKKRKNSPQKPIQLKDLGANKFLPIDKNGANSKPATVSLDDNSSSMEFLENVAEGTRTNLNTIEFKYYGFYERIKKQVEQQWNSYLIPLLDPNEKYNRSLETGVVIKVNKDGRILGINLEKSCGIPSLDKVAIETFKTIDVIHNPPKELFQDKEFLFLQWIFHVKI